MVFYILYVEDEFLLGINVIEGIDEVEGHIGVFSIGIGFFTFNFAYRRDN